MRIKFFPLLALLLVGAGCSGGSVADVNDIETEAFTLRVPDSAKVTATSFGWRIEDPDDTYYVDISTDVALGDYQRMYEDAEKTELGLSETEVWYAGGYTDGYDWMGGGYFHEASGTLIEEYYASERGVLLTTLLLEGIFFN